MGEKDKDYESMVADHHWITGSEALLRSLLAEGTECVFGYPGGNVLYIYDAMVKYPEFKHILTRHEQGRSMQRTDTHARQEK